jgi:hypothetical protein
MVDENDFLALRRIADFYARPATSEPRPATQKPLKFDSYLEDEKYPLDELCWGETKPNKIIQSHNLGCPIKSCPEYDKQRDVSQYKEDGVLKGITKSGSLGDHKSEMPYACVCECNRCSTKFWFHLDKKHALLLQPNE